MEHTTTSTNGNTTNTFTTTTPTTTQTLISTANYKPRRAVTTHHVVALPLYTITDNSTCTITDAMAAARACLQAFALPLDANTRTITGVITNNITVPKTATASQRLQARSEEIKSQK